MEQLRSAWLLSIAVFPKRDIDHHLATMEVNMLRMGAEAELKRMTKKLDGYVLLAKPASYTRKLCLRHDPAEWRAWEIVARLSRAKRQRSDKFLTDFPFGDQPCLVQCRDVIIIAIRRSFIPPSLDAHQDFVVTMFSPSTFAQSELHRTKYATANDRLFTKDITTQLTTLCRGIVDSLQPSSIPVTLNFKKITQRDRALTLGIRSYRWVANLRYKLSLQYHEKAKLFCAAVRKLFLQTPQGHPIDNDTEDLDPVQLAEEICGKAIETMSHVHADDEAGMHELQNRVWAYLGNCLNGAVKFRPSMSLISLFTSRNPSNGKVHDLARRLLRLRQRRGKFHLHKSFKDLAKDLAVITDMVFNENVMYAMLESHYVEQILGTDTDVFLTHVFKYCLQSSARKLRTKQLQSAICRRWLRFAKSTQAKQQVLTAEVLVAEIVVLLSRVQDEVILTYLVACLVDFAYDNGHMKNHIMRLGTAELVIGFLDNPNADLVRHSCALLVNCSTDKNHAHIIRSFNVIPKLLHLLKPRDFEPLFRSKALLLQVLRVATNLVQYAQDGDRTIADLGLSDKIETKHVAEALQYRSKSE